jgi:hypothetical protein
MNAIGAHGSDRNFVRAIGAAAADTKAAFNGGKEKTNSFDSRPSFIQKRKRIFGC